MTITLDLGFYYTAVGAIAICLSGQWAFRKIRSLIPSR